MARAKRAGTPVEACRLAATPHTRAQSHWGRARRHRCQRWWWWWQRCQRNHDNDNVDDDDDDDADDDDDDDGEKDAQRAGDGVVAIPIASRTTSFALRLRPGQEIVAALSAFVTRAGLRAAFVQTCVGSVSGATLRMATATADSDEAQHVSVGVLCVCV